MVDGSTREVTSKWSLVPSFPPGHHCCHGHLHTMTICSMFSLSLFHVHVLATMMDDFPGQYNVVMGTSTHTTAIIANGKQYQEFSSESRTFCADKLISLIFYRHCHTLSGK